MSDETEPTPPTPPASQPQPSGGAYSQGEKISRINVADEIKNSFLDYSMSVIISRALPDVRDGLKPSQRRILYAMHELGAAARPRNIEVRRYLSAKRCGNYHPHGDRPIYPTLVHMAQPWAMRERLIEGKGNFGSVEGDPPGGHALHRGAPDPSRRHPHGGHRQGHRRFRPELRREEHGAGRAPRRVSQSAGQRRHRHRRRHGHQPRARTI